MPYQALIRIRLDETDVAAARLLAERLCERLNNESCTDVASLAFLTVEPDVEVAPWPGEEGYQEEVL